MPPRTNSPPGHPSPAGFTLVELSIALVIIGLLAGGILVGQDLIAAAKRRAIINEEEKIVTAVTTFRLKYNCIPGDCLTATGYFDTATGACGTFTVNSTPRVETCNGNGNGAVDAIEYGHEAFRAMQQLADANLIPGPFTGTCIDGGAGCSPGFFKFGVDMPASKAFPNGGWLLYNQTSFELGGFGPSLAGGVWFWTNTPRQNVLWFTSDQPHNWGQHGAVSHFTPADAYAVDVKMDDGLPAFGRVVTDLLGSAVYGCHGPGPDTTTTYSVTATSGSCSLVFDLGF